MSTDAFDCLLVRSRDREMDQMYARMLEFHELPVEQVNSADLLETLQARTRPAVVLTHLNTATGQWRRTMPAVASTPQVTQRFAYVLLTLYREWVSQLVENLPPEHDVTVLCVPLDMAQLIQTIEEAGQRVVCRWEPHAHRQYHAP